jgi:hypothetical protein
MADSKEQQSGDSKLSSTETTAKPIVNAVAPSKTSVSFSASVAAPCFYHWKEIYPELDILIKNIDIIRQEALNIGKVSTVKL